MRFSDTDFVAVYIKWLRIYQMAHSTRKTNLVKKLPFLGFRLRKGSIVVNRGPLIVNPENGKEKFNQLTCFKGRVIDRVYPGGKFVSLFSIVLLCVFV